MPPKIQALSTASQPLLARCVLHSALLVFESCDKRPSLGSSSNLQSPEESHGVLGRVLYTWINPILFQGYTNILVDQDLPPLSQDMKPEFIRKSMLQRWYLRESIKYVVAYPTEEESSRGFWLVVSAVAIYIGLALSTAVYQHRINRLKLITRGALVGLIHEKTMESPSIAYDNGEATTLMSTDADSLDGIAEMVHETWAQVIEVFIGVGLLAIQVGWIWPLPLFLIYLCSHMSRFVAKNLRPRQKAWNVATQNRIGATSSFISSMKIIKMIGLQHNLTRRVQQLRKEELWVASKLRWVMVYYNASANALGIFSPAITLALFAVISQANGFKLNPTTAFPTMAILSMITHPANMVMTIVPRVVAAFAGFERIQSFLLRPSLQNNRGVLPRLTQNEVASSHPTNLNLAVQIQQLRIGDKQAILDDINIEVHATSFIIISGPTGSGKSTLLRTIIGEVIPTRGSIYLSTRKIAYCSQRPWLPSGSIREVIYGANDIDGAINQDNEEWYNTVTEMCCLTHDFDTLPDGDQTQIGSRGLNLSGGQRQRVYFQSADHVVVLGDHGIIDQGDWQSIKIKAGSIAKFSSGNNIKDNAAVVAAFAKLSAQVRAKDEAEIDLARQSGDSALYEIFKLLMQVILLFVAQKWLTVSLPACMLVVYVVQKVYLRTSRQLRFLELEARAGVFSSFLESVEGLETIRSFGWSSAVIEDNITSVDNAQRPEFLLLCLQRWLNIVLDLLAATVATSVIALAVVYRDNVSGAQVGIALNVMLVANTTLLKLVESWTTLEISLGAIARLRTLENMTPLEGGMAQTLEPVESWPSKGNVEFKNITASYLPGSTALKNLSLNITSGQKIIVCGRTGSGKSTLLLTLLRLLELQSGQIILDDVDIKKAGLDILRQRCFITVSQDPLLLSNETLRFNLDPDGSTSNETLIASLKRTELWFFLQGATETDDISGPASDNTPHNPHPILDKPLSSFPELSVGQSQLLALCRALVKAQTAQHAGRKPIVLLDEVTSSLDSVTESIIHGIIDDEFTQKGHTVICVAHRIEALAKHTEPGRVAVVLLSNGRLQEVITDLNSGTWERLGRLD
ncbi:hypothetical protein ACHAO8_006140 [Botrytis cinerea]